MHLIEHQLRVLAMRFFRNVIAIVVLTSIVCGCASHEEGRDTFFANFRDVCLESSSSPNLAAHAADTSGWNTVAQAPFAVPLPLNLDLTNFHTWTKTLGQETLVVITSNGWTRSHEPRLPVEACSMMATGVEGDALARVSQWAQVEPNAAMPGASYFLFADAGHRRIHLSEADIASETQRGHAVFSLTISTQSNHTVANYVRLLPPDRNLQ
ncbi:MAG: hypothetical protein QM759_10535 [Terricaulis sp.]